MEDGERFRGADGFSDFVNSGRCKGACAIVLRPGGGSVGSGGCGDYAGGVGGDCMVRKLLFLAEINVVLSETEANKKCELITL